MIRTMLLLGCLAGTTIAAAQDGPPRGGGGAGRGGGMGMMREADTDGDGAISRAEFQAVSDSRFARLDANGDGKIDAKESPMRSAGRRDFAPPPAPGAAPAPPPAGDITRDQFRTIGMARFDALDADHDGRIDAAEQEAARAALRARFGRGATPPHPPGT
jgi:hypothetical protein